MFADHKKEDNNRSQIRLLCLNNEDVIVNADKERVTQVISNLLSNAIKFTNEGEGISVDVKRDNTAKQIDISVKDAGQGIDAEIYPRLFTKFAKKSIVGTGQGLFISKKIIEAHDEGYGLKITQLERVLHFLSVYLLVRINSIFTIVIQIYLPTKLQIPLAEDDVLYLHAQH